MYILTRAALLAACLAVPSVLASAQDMPMSGGAMDHGAHMGAPASPAAEAFGEANARMHAEMALPFTGDTDIDFARGMIPHHQGAIDMARIELEYGKDPELRALAEQIVKAQEGEIAFLKAWLAKNAK